MDLNDAMYNVRSSSKNSEWEVYIANNATLFWDLMSLGMQHSSLIWLRLNQPFVSLKNFISQLPMKIFCLKINMLDLSWYDEWKTIDYRKGWDLSPLLQSPINIFSHHNRRQFETHPPASLPHNSIFCVSLINLNWSGRSHLILWCALVASQQTALRERKESLLWWILI